MHPALDDGMLDAKEFGDLGLPACSVVVRRSRTLATRTASFSYYLEAVSAFSDPGTAATCKKWFWEETRLAKAMLALQLRLAASDEQRHEVLADLTMIPASERHCLSQSGG
jgi:hypothetical protein